MARSCEYQLDFSHRQRDHHCGFDKAEDTIRVWWGLDRLHSYVSVDFGLAINSQKSKICQ